jgi:ubiquinone/menaquinone biosynthesis C-methylase UbiE
VKAGNAERRAALQAQRAAALAEQLDDLLVLTGDERVLDVGAGAGAFAFALAPHVREVIAVEIDEELAARARADAPANVEVIVGDGENLPFDSFSFEVAGTLRTLHHTPRPELLVAELTRVTRPGGTILVVDQIAPTDPLAAIALTQFEHARDPSTTRVLSSADLRGVFDSNNLILRREVTTNEPRDTDAYLDLAGCEGVERERAMALAPEGYEMVVGWFVLTRG